MRRTADRILIVEEDPIICDLIARQALGAAGYGTIVVNNSSAAISRAVQESPDAIIVDLSLPGLSGKDLLVALTAQNIDIPVVVLAKGGDEADIVHAFRLGASDYLLWPVREAEVITVMERVLKHAHTAREREQLSQKLQQTNLELKQRVQELTTIYSIGKAVTSIMDQTLLFDRILEGAVSVTQSDMGWFLLREETDQAFLIVAQQNLPDSLAVYINHSWDDGLSSLVAMSGETLSIQGEALNRFKIANLGRSVLIVPIKAQKAVIGMLVMVRKSAKPFSERGQHILEAMADYASISLINARLFQELEQRAQKFQSAAETARLSQQVTNELLKEIKAQLQIPTEYLQQIEAKLNKPAMSRWTADQRQQLVDLNSRLKIVQQTVEAIAPEELLSLSDSVKPVDLVLVAQSMINHVQPFAQRKNCTLFAELPEKPLWIGIEKSLLSQMLLLFLINIIQVNRPGGQIRVQVGRLSDKMAYIVVNTIELVLNGKEVSQIFDGSYYPKPEDRSRFGGLGTGLPLLKKLVDRKNGKLWVESDSKNGSRFYLSLPLQIG